MHTVTAATLLLSVTLGCSSTRERPSTTGITGEVQVLRGNHMPSPDRPAAGKDGAPRGTLEERKVYLYHTLTSNDWDHESGLKKDRGSLITETIAKGGRFEFEVPPGTYSVLVEDHGKKYCNSFTFDAAKKTMHICEVVVRQGREQIVLRVTSEAYF